MAPTLFELFGVAVPAYFVCTCLAYVVGFSWLHRGAVRVVADRDGLVGLYMSLLVSGWLGARLMHIVGGEGAVRPAAIAEALVSSGGGVAFLGGVMGGTLGAVLYMGWARLPMWKLLDTAAPGLMLGLGVGRLGCFFAGCCHGREVAGTVVAVGSAWPGGEVVWIDTFPHLAFVFHDIGYGSIFDVPVYPTQALEVAGALVLSASLVGLAHPRRRFDGQVFAWMLVGYGLLRWVGEGFRGDAIRGASHAVWGASLSTGQLSSLALGLVAAGIWWRRAGRGVAPEPVERPPDPPDAVELDLPAL